MNKVIVFGNVERGMERFNSLLSIFGLQDRMLSWGDDVTKITKTKIDYSLLEPTICDWKIKSMNFINDALK